MHTPFKINYNNCSVMIFRILLIKMRSCTSYCHNKTLWDLVCISSGKKSHHTSLFLSCVTAYFFIISTLSSRHACIFVISLLLRRTPTLITIWEQFCMTSRNNWKIHRNFFVVWYICPIYGLPWNCFISWLSKCYLFFYSLTFFLLVGDATALKLLSNYMNRYE